MIISLERRFIFVATLKTASTSIEDILRRYAEISIVEAKYGKHMTFEQIQDNFSWLLSEIPVDHFFTFAVLRHPVDYLLSLYNSHKADQFSKSESLYTGHMSFDEFLEVWTERNADQVTPQYKRLLNKRGEIAPTLIIGYNRLKEGLGVVADRIGVPELSDLPRINVSPRGLTATQLSKRQLGWIHDKFHADLEFIRRHCNMF